MVSVLIAERAFAAFGSTGFGTNPYIPADTLPDFTPDASGAWFLPFGDIASFSSRKCG